MNPATISFKTVGCRLNQAETAAMRASCEAAGFRAVPFGNPSAVCVIHGCTVTARAEKDSLRLARSARRLRPDAFVVLAGCVSEIGGEASRAACGADLALGQDRKFDLPAVLCRHGIRPPARARRPAGDGAVRGESPVLPRFDTTRATVRIQNGCDFRCAYCIVPYARGRPESRSIETITREITGLGEAGHKEVVLTGANIGCYDDDGRKLVHLLERVEEISSIERVRISSIEISTVERSVIDFMSESSKCCRFLHLPLQSGDDGMLEKMGRRYTADRYREVVAYATDRLGPFGLGTDVIVGFPGEDERAFAASERLIEDLPFGNLHVFTYSSRPGTAAGGMRDDVPDSVKRDRAARLIRLGRLKRASYAQSRVGCETSVLIETVDENGRGFGWTGEYLKARVAGAGLRPNRVVTFVPRRAAGETLVGTWAGD